MEWGRLRGGVSFYPLRCWYIKKLLSGVPGVSHHRAIQVQEERPCPVSAAGTPPLNC